MTACIHYSQAAKNKKISLLKSLVRFHTFVKSVATQGGIKQKERSKEVLFPSETVVASKRNGSPLISIDCASVLEGTQKFKEEFGERYCINGRDHLMPPFKIGSLLSVIREDTEGDRRRLALYIHNDKSAFRNIFPREDVTEKVNERMLMNELSRCPREISRVVTAVLEQVDRNVDLFPFLIVFKMMNERELKMVDYTTGAFSPTQAREKLISCMEINN